MTGHVGERNQDSSVREHLPIEVVAAGLVSRATPTSNVVAGHVRLGAGQQSSLNLAGDVQVALHPLPDTFLDGQSLDVGPQIGRHAVETMGQVAHFGRRGRFVHTSRKVATANIHYGMFQGCNGCRNSSGDIVNAAGD